jgi:hypothetical protein
MVAQGCGQRIKATNGVNVVFREPDDRTVAKHVAVGRGRISKSLVAIEINVADRGLSCRSVHRRPLKVSCSSANYGVDAGSRLRFFRDGFFWRVDDNATGGKIDCGDNLFGKGQQK